MGLKEPQIIMFYLNHLNHIRYITNDMNSYEAMSYKKFIEWIAKFGVINYFKMVDEINKFNTIVYYKETMNWEVRDLEIDESEITWENLAKLNKDKLIQKKKDAVQPKKESKLNILSKLKKKQLDKHYGRSKSQNQSNSGRKLLFR
jgi:hypothetical protein